MEELYALVRGIRLLSISVLVLGSLLYNFICSSAEYTAETTVYYISLVDGPILYDNLPNKVILDPSPSFKRSDDIIIVKLHLALSDKLFDTDSTIFIISTRLLVISSEILLKIYYHKYFELYYISMLTIKLSSKRRSNPFRSRKHNGPAKYIKIFIIYLKLKLFNSYIPEVGRACLLKVY
ncbi:hypothetical protein AGLY_004898 [Aphis glycines]|uniref:Uncharacterized protein n=1 Tax=Aphis glycines TaxID=307491 RepID=A0A6G0TWG7_APHGL|nr:hypothetical protein AGLY_004898 [Aphis glycines]